LERRKLVAEAHAQEKSEQQSLWVQVSAKLTPEICINNASSNSRLTTTGRQATVAETILRTVSRLFFFFLCLPTFDERTTELQLQAEKLTETVLHLNLGHLGGYFCACVCSFVLLYESPLMRQLQNNIRGTISRIGDCDFTAFELGGFLVFWFF
jgi:hypothetical protein